MKYAIKVFNKEPKQNYIAFHELKSGNVYRIYKDGSCYTEIAGGLDCNQILPKELYELRNFLT